MRIERVLQVLLWVAYPVLIYFGLQWLEPRAMAGLLALLLVLRRHREARAFFRELSRLDLAILAVMLGWTALAAITNDEHLLRLYPAVASLSMLALFGHSLRRPPTMIERFARLAGTPPGPEAGPYLRRVTQVWCAFFVVNAAVAVYTALWTPRAVWAFYNGLAVYVVMGVLFAGEWLVRQRMLRATPERA